MDCEKKKTSGDGTERCGALWRGAQARAVTRSRLTAPARERRASERERERDIDREGRAKWDYGILSSPYRVFVVRACTSSSARPDLPVSRAVISRGRRKWRGAKCGVTTQPSRPKGPSR